MLEGDGLNPRLGQRAPLLPEPRLRVALGGKTRGHQCLTTHHRGICIEIGPGPLICHGGHLSQAGAPAKPLARTRIGHPPAVSARRPSRRVADPRSGQGLGRSPGLAKVTSMTDEWTWTYFDADASVMSGEALVTTGFPSQSDAETWLGEQWRSLAEAGVEAVTLKHEGVVVYGPMSLRAAQ